ncbi:alpha/beta-hydrolase [Aspergillus ellipticus CBS 707.79]|uniref:Alpha/beta-hydrolase n=1 Tax=Aspergillus ellipticus CBS 707.79 TaxID=1448320 RepID=A0A319DDR4_9EURO|nr:alpha/beta-hydrolase [Aspergillus ellipticus CBS 707.79]
MSAPFSQLPSTAKISPSPFNISIAADQQADLKTLIQLSRLAPPTYENSQADRRFGITSDWLKSIREKWINNFDWQAFETRANSFPQFTTQIEGLTVHFVALLSQKPDAIPILTHPVNMCAMVSPPGNISPDTFSATEKQAATRMKQFMDRGRAYAEEHGSRLSTIGHVLASSPLALLAWVGEKYLDWVDKPLPDETVLEMVSLYWFTESFPRAIYPYREFTPFQEKRPLSLEKELYIHKPLGFSFFPEEIIPVPPSWVATTGNLVFSREHVEGGHFAALELPREMKDDLSAFVERVWVK